MKRTENRSRCPINLALETFGDTWSLLIVRDMMLWGKNTYGEFQESGEDISPSVLADRLDHLVEKGILSKQPAEEDKRKMVYSLTNKGLELIPIVYELVNWGVNQHEDPLIPPVCMKALDEDRETVIEAWRKALESGSSFLNGSESAVERLGL